MIYLIGTLEPWRQKDFDIDSTLQEQLNKHLVFPWKDIRFPGYFLKYEDAKIAVINNASDIWETCYDYAIIECIPSGLYPNINREWFIFDQSLDKYIPCEPPKWDQLNYLAGSLCIG